jgi:hypothetical protein
MYMQTVSGSSYQGRLLPGGVQVAEIVGDKIPSYIYRSLWETILL